MAIDISKKTHELKQLTANFRHPNKRSFSRFPLDYGTLPVFWALCSHQDAIKVLTGHIAASLRHLFKPCPEGFYAVPTTNVLRNRKTSPTWWLNPESKFHDEPSNHGLVMKSAQEFSVAEVKFAMSHMSQTFWSPILALYCSNMFEYLQPPLTTAYATAIYRTPQPLSGPCPHSMAMDGYGPDCRHDRHLSHGHDCEDRSLKWATCPKKEKVAFFYESKRGHCRGTIFSLYFEPKQWSQQQQYKKKNEQGMRQKLSKPIVAYLEGVMQNKECKTAASTASYSV